MARKTVYGKPILSAGEIGSYVVCPEAWRLRMISKVRGVYSASIEEGRKRHQEWARKYDEAVFLTIGAKVVVALVLLSIIVYCFS